METLLKKRTGAPGDYTSVAFETLRDVQENTPRTGFATKPAPQKSLGLTPAEFPGDEEERMTFIHQYPSSALEDDMDDDDIDEDLDEEEIDDVDLDEDEGDFEDVSDDELDDDDLEVDLEDEEEEEDVI